MINLLFLSIQWSGELLEDNDRVGMSGLFPTHSV